MATLIGVRREAKGSGETMFGVYVYSDLITEHGSHVSILKEGMRPGRY